MKNLESLRSDQPSQPVALLVDDDVLVLNMARITLERDGYFLLAAENGVRSAGSVANISRRS